MDSGCPGGAELPSLSSIQSFFFLCRCWARPQDQQPLPPLGCWQKCSIPGPTPDTSSQNLHFNKIPQVGWVLSFCKAWGGFESWALPSVVPIHSVRREAGWVWKSPRWLWWAARAESPALVTTSAVSRGVVPGPAAPTSPGNPLETQHLHAHTRAGESEPPGWAQGSAE